MRELLLWIYRLFVEKGGGEVLVTDLVEVLALRYQLEYSGVAATGQLMNDFRIVAAASLHEINLFVSADKKQISKDCASVYAAVNLNYQLETSELVLYADFRKLPEKYASEGLA